MEPMYDQAGMMYADLNMELVTQSRFDYDVVGHYNRPDVFQLVVNESRKDIVSFKIDN
ncbi:Nitrilase [compost metagenome]